MATSRRDSPDTVAGKPRRSLTGFPVRPRKAPVRSLIRLGLKSYATTGRPGKVETALEHAPRRAGTGRDRAQLP